MNFITENWYIVLFAIIGCVVLGVFIYRFIKLPKELQIAAIKEWLKYAVALAELEFGSGTGQLKLRSVYDMFISKFPTISKAITFEIFSTYVDEALEWLEIQLENNISIATLIKGTEENKEVI